MNNMPTKKETMKTIYFGPGGFGSLKQINKDAQAKDDTTTYEDVICIYMGETLLAMAPPAIGNIYIYIYMYMYPVRVPECKIRADTTP